MAEKAGKGRAVLTNEQVAAVATTLRIRLERLRRPKFETYKEIADALGVHQSRYIPVEKGNTYFRIDILIQVLHFWGFDLLDVFAGHPVADPPLEDPVVRCALEQLRVVLQSPGIEGELALQTVRHWHASLPSDLRSSSLCDPVQVVDQKTKLTDSERAPVNKNKA